MNSVYVIYCDELKGFLSNDGVKLTEDIEEAMHYPSVGQAMMASYKSSERFNEVFKFYEVNKSYRP